MTNERFIYILDNDEDTIYDLLEKNILSKKDIEDKMNELHEENQQLKKEIEGLNWELTEIKKSEDENYEIMDGL